VQFTSKSEKQKMRLNFAVQSKTMMRGVRTKLRKLADNGPLAGGYFKTVFEPYNMVLLKKESVNI
jgi:hypothetical protein